MDADPPRLRDDDELGWLVESLREDEPTSATDAAVLAALRTVDPTSTLTPPRTSSGVTSPASMPTWLPRGLALVGLTVVAAGMLWWALRSPTPRTPPPRSVVPTTPAAESTPPPATTTEASPAPRALESPLEMERETAPAPATAPSSPRRPNARVSEEELLLTARQALPNDPARAQRALARHARQFPSGVLAEEREALRIDVLNARGRHAAASRALAVFSRTFPRSAHVERLRRVLEQAHPNEPHPPTRP